jgi:hypothetical protein
LETLFEDDEREEGGRGSSDKKTIANSSHPFVDVSILFIIMFY